MSGYIVDVSDLDAVADTAAAVLDEVGRIDVSVNNAGVVRGNHYFWETELERDAKFTIDVDTFAPMRVAHAFLPAMIAASGNCRLLDLASAASFTPNPRMACTPPRSGRSSAPLLPILGPADVVDEALTAMLAGGSFVVLPKTVMLSEMLKGVVPIDVRDFIADRIIGVYHTMDDFTGRAETGN